MSNFSMISNFKKLNFCNFSAHLPSLHNPIIFPFQGGILRSGNSQSNPRHFPEYLPFQRAFAPKHLPSLFLLVRLSGASLWSIAPIQCPVASPCFFPFWRASYAAEAPNHLPAPFPLVRPFRGNPTEGRFITKIRRLRQELKPFNNKLSFIQGEGESLFRGDFRVETWAFGTLGGQVWVTFSPGKYPPKRD